MAAKTSDWRPGPTVCRCCLTEGCYKDISTEYFWMGKREVYAEMLSETLDVSISYSKSGGPNSNSRLICEPCIARLRDASDFKRQVLECEKTFMQHLDSGSVSAEKEDVLTLKEVKVELVKQEGKLSDDDDDFEERVDFVVENDDTDDDLDNEPLMKLATKVPKKEVELLDLLDNSEITVKRKSTSTKTKEPPAKKVKKREIVIKPSASKASASSDPQVVKKKKGAAKKWSTKSEARDNAAVILECSNVCPFEWRDNKFGCPYCDFTSIDIGSFRKHSAQHSNRTGILNKFSIGKIINVDVTDLKCDICDTYTKNIYGLVEHLIKMHDKPIAKEYGLGMIPYFMANGFTCVECGETFDRFIELAKHINVHYQNNICPLCGRAFSSYYKLNFHIDSMHKKPAKYKCTICGEEFPTLTLKRNHRSTVHNIGTYKCPLCSEAFQMFYQKLKHLNEYHGKNINYPCDLCPAVLRSASSRSSHRRRVHEKEKSLMCNVCSSMFMTTSELKDHMLKHKVVDKSQYTCKVCEKSYSRRRTLVWHMRVHNH